MYNYQILDTNEELHPVCLGEYETYNEAYIDFKAMGGFNKEVRWLEWVNIQYRFYEGEIYYDHINRVHYRRYGWIKEKFIEVE